MARIVPPTTAQLETFRGAQQRQDFTYKPVGGTQGSVPAGFDHDHNRVRIGEGRDAFEAARQAIRRWEMFPADWSVVHPAGEPPVEGSTVVVAFDVVGRWWLNACRIVYTLDEARRFGFAYGTLPGHVERGEERFMIEWLDDDSVWYDIDAFSTPRHWLARIGYPIARRLQRRFVRESQAAMRSAVEGSAAR